MGSALKPIPSIHRMRFGLIVAAILISLVDLTTAQQPAAPTILQGRVQDSQFKPVADAVLELRKLELQNSTLPVTIHVDSKGKYCFVGLAAGTYSLRVTSSGYAAETSSLSIRESESKTFDVTLVPESTPPKSASASAPQFFDPPKFSVSGVTDTANAGGHGSDSVVRVQNSVAKQAAMLNQPAAAGTRVNSTDSEKALREGVAQHPHSFEANHRLGMFLVENGEARDAIPYLENAAEINRTDYENSYNLAVANAEAGNFERARDEAQTLLTTHDKAEVHHLLGNIDEHVGDPVASVREYQRAAEMAPNESYLFDWGSELLAHHAPEPALDVFNRANSLFPHSTRMLIGQGAAWFSAGAYDKAVRSICAASDENPSDPNPYLFLGMMQRAEIAESEEVTTRLRRFVKLQPDNAQANYYYAVALLKNAATQQNGNSESEAESLLERAVHLDANLAPAALQLGVIHARKGDLKSAVSDYQKAILADPKMEEAHYRLSQAYRQLGNADKAKEEAGIYQQLAKESAANAERERHEMRQFVYTLRDQTAPQNP